MRRASLLAVAIALLSTAGPAAAADPSAPGVWGAIYDGYWNVGGQEGQRARDLACLTNPVLLREREEEGYEAISYVLDLEAFATGALAYLDSYRVDCR